MNMTALLMATLKQWGPIVAVVVWVPAGGLLIILYWALCYAFKSNNGAINAGRTMSNESK